jgi:hypothetical protein
MYWIQGSLVWLIYRRLTKVALQKLNPILHIKSQGDSQKLNGQFLNQEAEKTCMFLKVIKLHSQPSNKTSRPSSNQKSCATATKKNASR